MDANVFWTSSLDVAPSKGHLGFLLALPPPSADVVRLLLPSFFCRAVLKAGHWLSSAVKRDVWESSSSERPAA